MARFALSIVAAVICLVSVAYGMDCTWGTSDNVIEKYVNSCPGVFDSSEKSYCCPKLDGSFECCNWAEFAAKTGLGIIVPVIIAVVVIISLIVFCISCLCCACCPWYRRRHRGTVYSSMQTPGTGVHVIQAPPGNSAYTIHQIQNQPPIYATPGSAMPQHPAPPPQYTREDYTKQAPYNPGYVQ